MFMIYLPMNQYHAQCGAAALAGSDFAGNIHTAHGAIEAGLCGERILNHCQSLTRGSKESIVAREWTKEKVGKSTQKIVQTTFSTTPYTRVYAACGLARVS
jgi:hypothetical protein